MEAVEARLKKVGIALAGIDAGTGGQTVAEADQDGAVVVGLCCNRLGGGCLGESGRGGGGGFCVGVGGAAVCVAAEESEQATRQDRDRINFPHRSNVSKIPVYGWKYLRLVAKECVNLGDSLGG
jgi:hypothetical protein